MSQQSERRAGTVSTVLLVLGVAMCLAFTVIEFNRAMDGHGRAWIYTFQWPLIGAFLVWMWYRYRNEGNVVQGFTEHYRKKIEEVQQEAEDPDLRAWQDYVAKVNGKQP